MPQGSNNAPGPRKMSPSVGLGHYREKYGMYGCVLRSVGSDDHPYPFDRIGDGVRPRIRSLGNAIV